MDANLFGSFSRSLNQKRRRSSLKESTDTKTSNNGGASQKESTSALFGGAGKDEETKSISLTPVEKKAVTKPLVPDTSQPKSKKAFGESRLYGAQVWFRRARVLQYAIHVHCITTWL